MMMKKYLNKITGISLASIMAFSMTGCGNTNTTENNTNNSTQNTTVNNTATSDIKADITEKALTEGEKLAEQYNGFVETPMDLGGRTIRIITDSIGKFKLANDDKGNPSREATDNQVLYIVDAMEKIEQDYNCKFEYTKLKGAELVEQTLAAKAAGDTIGEILEFGVSSTYPDQLYSNNICIALDSPELIDIVQPYSNPWHSASGFGNMYGHQYGVHFKAYNTADVLRSVIVFNKDLAEKYNVGNLYDMVRNKTWTFDNFKQICANIASQANGEVYPFLYHQEGLTIPMFAAANGGSFSENTATGFKFTAVQDNTLEAMNFIVDLAKQGYIHPGSENKKNAGLTYANGEAVFFAGGYSILRNFKSGTYDTNSEFGLLPAPLGPNGTEYCSISYTEQLFNIFNGNEKPEEIAAVFVAIANRTSKKEKDIIEQELMNTLFDEDSAEMLELMYNNTLCDYSREFTEARKIIPNAVRSTLKANEAPAFTFEKTPKEAMEEIEATVQASYDNIIMVQ